MALRRAYNLSVVNSVWQPKLKLKYNVNKYFVLFSVLKLSPELAWRLTTSLNFSSSVLYIFFPFYIRLFLEFLVVFLMYLCGLDTVFSTVHPLRLISILWICSC